MESVDRTDDVALVPFEIDGHRYGVLVADVREIVRAATPSPLPGAPAAVLGVLNVRGALVPVFDVRRRFGLAPRPLRAADAMIVVDLGGMRAAIAVDRADALLHVPADRIERARLQSTSLEPIAGVAKLEDGNVVIYDLLRFLSDAERAVLGETLARAAASPASEAP